jgi:hypothetical protein
VANDEHSTEPVRRPSLFGVALLTACAAAWLVAALPSLTDTGYAIPFDLLLIAAWYLVARFWFRLPYTSPAGLRSRPWRRLWLAAGSIVVLGPVLGLTDLGLMVRLYLCEPQVAAYVAGLAPKTAEFPHEPRAVGLFQVVGTWGSPGGASMQTTTGFLDHRLHGLVYAPGHAGPLVYNKHRTSHLYGPWYAFR